MGERIRVYDIDLYKVDFFFEKSGEMQYPL